MGISTNSWRVAALSAALVAIALIAGVPGRLASQARAANEPTGNVLLAATLQLPEVQTAFGTPDNWFEWYPGVEDAGHFRKGDAPTGFVIGGQREFQRFGADSTMSGLVSSVLYVFTDDAAAIAYLNSKAAEDAASTPLPGQPIGDQSLAFTYEYAREGIPADAFRFETYIRFRAGRSVGIVDVNLAEHITYAKLSALASPIISRTAAAFAGTLQPGAIPAALAAVAPPASVLTAAGPMLERVALSIDTWTLAFAARVAERARLATMGAGVFSYDLYAVTTLPRHLLSVSIIPLKDEPSARNLVLFDTDGTPSRTELSTGTTGAYSIFRNLTDFKHYDFQFARNRYYVAVSCEIAGGANAPLAACEAITRNVAQLVYASLPADQTAPSATPTQPPATATVTATATATATGSATVAATATPTRQAPLPPNTGNGPAAGDSSTLPLVLLPLAMALGGASLILAMRRRTNR